VIERERAPEREAVKEMFRRRRIRREMMRSQEIEKTESQERDKIESYRASVLSAKKAKV
jgi:hypothetical protein